MQAIQACSGQVRRQTERQEGRLGRKWNVTGKENGRHTHTQAGIPCWIMIDSYTRPIWESGFGGRSADYRRRHHHWVDFCSQDTDTCFRSWPSLYHNFMVTHTKLDEGEEEETRWWLLALKHTSISHCDRSEAIFLSCRTNFTNVGKVNLLAHM